jgi:hypothetical protein
LTGGAAYERRRAAERRRGPYVAHAEWPSLRQRRKAEKAKRHAPSAPTSSCSTATCVRHATEVERLAYTRTQAAEALGMSPTTFSRRVLPLIETIDMPWGPRLFSVDQLERFVNARRRPARGRAETAPPGRPTAVPDELLRHIQAEHAKGKSLHQIARDLNASETPRAHRRRTVVALDGTSRSQPPKSARDRSGPR